MRPGSLTLLQDPSRISRGAVYRGFAASLALLLSIPSIAIPMLSMFSLAACGGASTRSNGPSRALPSYSGHAAELFDDVIEPKSVGLGLDGAGVPKSDPVLRERTQVADAVLHVQVATLSSKREGVTTGYTIGFRILEKLAGSASPPDDFSVKLDKTSPSLGIVRNFEERLVGKKFVIFVRAFTFGDGVSGDDSDFHFHVVPDTKAEIDAIRAAAILAEMK
jgi:hypothetical protein